jgi:hypothetical protein
MLDRLEDRPGSRSDDVEETWMSEALLDLNSGGLDEGVAIPGAEAKAMRFVIALDRCGQALDAGPITGTGMPVDAGRGDLFAESSIASPAMAGGADAEILVAISTDSFHGIPDAPQWPTHAGSDSAGWISRQAPHRSLPAA